jgi:hypothetical protein
LQARKRISGVPPRRRAKSNGTRRTRPKKTFARLSLREVIRRGRGLPQKLRRAVETHPEVALIAVGGVSFLAGVLLDSRLGRAVLSVAVPFGLQRLVESELAPRLWSSALGIIRKATDEESVALGDDVPVTVVR